MAQLGPGVSAVKYYLYVSDAKVDMLYAQIPPSLLDGLSAELRSTSSLSH